MVIADLQYGLGNQLFQYATGRAVAERVGAPLFLDPTHFLHVRSRALDIEKFKIKARFLPALLGKLLTSDRARNPLKNAVKAVAAGLICTLHDAEQGYDPRVERLGWFSRVDGLWQSERYFAPLRPQLLEELELREPLTGGVAAFIRRAGGEPSVALHVRRGDLVTDVDYAETVGVLAPAYYEEVLSRLKALEPDARVYVFSDDPAWCAENLPCVLPMEIVSGRHTHSATEDFAAMKACRHFVIANSTFSWWTAWLGRHPGKRVFTPDHFFRVPRSWEVDLLPPAWEKVSASFLSPMLAS